MKAIDRLLTIQAAYPLSCIEVNRLTEISDKLGLDAKLVGTSSVDRVKLLYEQLSLGLPPEICKKVQQGQIVVGEVGSTDPRAYIEKIDADNLLIVMHSGMFEFLYRIARPLSAALFRVKGEDVKNGIVRSELARIVCEIFWWQIQTGENYGPDYFVTNEQKHIANILANSAEVFLLAHEFGHAGIALTSDFGADDKFLSPTDEEMLADELGLRMFLSVQPSKITTSQELWLFSVAYAGAEFALQVWDVMSKLNLDFVDGIHPPSRERINRLRSVLSNFIKNDEVFERVLEIPRMIDKTFNEVVQIINSGGGEHAILFELQGRNVVNAINASLEKCAAGSIPDYHTFYGEVLELVNIGYAHQIISEIFGKVVGDIQEMDIQSGEIGSEVVIHRINRFKLLFGLSEKLPEPAKTLFKTSLARATN